MIIENNDIKYYAEGVARYYFGKHDEINPQLIAYANNISFNFSDYGNGFDGMLEFMDNSFHIYINSYGSELYSKRAIFTFGHELGHFFLPHHVNAIASGKIKAHLSKAGYSSSNKMENEADLFASCLLMPEFLIRKMYNSFRDFHPRLFDKIVKTFQVSPLAAIYRVLQLNLHPIMIVRSINGSIDKITGRSKDFYFRLNNQSELPEDSLASKFFTEGSQKKNLEKLWVVDWFDKDSTKEMWEYCLFYPKYNKVYSVLWVK